MTPTAAAVVIVAFSAAFLAVTNAQIYCPDGSVPQQRSDGLGAITCNNPGQVDVCNGGYICRNNPNNNPSMFVNVCCRLAPGETTSVAASCPNGLTPYVNPTTRQLVPCIAGNIGTCPQGATCEFLASNDASYRNLCCYNGITNPTSNVDTNAGQVACPNSESPWEPSPGQFVPCLLGMADNCPVGSNCRSMPSNRIIYRTLCCRDPNAPAFCQSNQIRNNGVCLPQVPLDQYCQIPAQCLGGGDCILNRCGCPTGRANVNGVCTTIDGSFTVVTCQSNQVFVNGACLLLVPPGVACQDTRQCIGQSTCVSGTCTCPAGTTLVDTICQPNSNVQTACGAGQMLVNGQCYSSAQIDQPCVVQQQCVGGSSCTSGFCRCLSGFINVNSLCTVAATSAPVSAATNARCATPSFVPMTPFTSCLRTTCPAAYKCEYDSTNQQYICCGAGGINNAVPVTTTTTDCPQANMAMYSGNRPLTCSTAAGSSPCPSTNPFCVRSSSLGYNVCCRTNINQG